MNNQYIFALLLLSFTLNALADGTPASVIKVLVTPVHTHACAEQNQRTIACGIIIGANGSGIRSRTSIEQRETILKIIETIPDEDDKKLTVTFSLNYKNEVPVPQTITINYGSSVALEAINHVHYFLTLATL